MRRLIAAIAAVFFASAPVVAMAAAPTTSLNITVVAQTSGVQTVSGCPIYTAGDLMTTDETTVALDANSATRIASYTASIVGNLTLQIQNTWHINAYATPVFYTDHSTSGHAALSGGFPWSSGAVISEHNSDDHGESLDTTNCVAYGGYWGNGASNIDNTGHNITFYASEKSNLRTNLTSSGYLGVSADLDMAGGIPVIPGMLVYQQYATDGAWNHALVMVVGAQGTCTSGFKSPASSNNGQSYSGSGSTTYCLRYGDHITLHSSYNCASFTTQNQAICATLKKYGAFVNDAASSALKLAADDDSRWASTSQLNGMKMSDFDVRVN